MPILSVAGKLILAATFAAAQNPSSIVAHDEKTTVHVGDGTIDGSVIQDYDNVWLVTVHYNDGRVVERGLSSDHVRLRTANGVRYGTRAEGTTAVIVKGEALPTSNFTMTFNVFDPMTMRPIRGESYGSTGESEIRHFSEKHVTTITKQSSSPDRTQETETPETVFDINGGMTGLLLAALPLKDGYTANIPGVGDTAFDTTPIRVIGQENVQAGHYGKCKTWVVEVGPAASVSTYWISKAPPYVIRATVKTSNAVASWDMIP
jgi:Protein of unknown function (DUF3108)